MKKTCFTFLFTVLMSMVGTNASAHDIEEVNADGKIIYYTYTNNNTDLAVSCRGSHARDYTDEYSGNVVIPESVTHDSKVYRVTSIGSEAFYECAELSSVTIPNSVTNVGKKAFFRCDGLTSITIPNSVKSIGGSAFLGCSSLTSITIPNSVTSIGDGAFQGSGLTSITIPNSLTSIPDNAFAYCDGMSSIKVESGNSKYDSRNNCNAIIETATNSLIYGCKNTVIPDGVTYIGYYAFVGCTGLTSIVIPNSVTKIGYSAFRECTSLTSVTVPNSVTDIYGSAFGGCSGLASITIGNSVTKIGDQAFANCVNLASITCLNPVPPACESNAFNTFTASLCVPAGSSIQYKAAEVWRNFSVISEKPVEIGGIYYSLNSEGNVAEVTGRHKGNSDEVVIPEYITYAGVKYNVTSIGNHAFQFCTDLTTVAIGNNVTTIGDWAFFGCRRLTSVNIPNSVTTIGEQAFRFCSSLTSITIPNSVTSIGLAMFSDCTGLTSIVIPNSVTNIDAEAFANCTALTSITIPNSVTNIGYAFGVTFARCSNLRDVYCYAKDVPNTYTNAFESSPVECATLHVPESSMENYMTTGPWSQFGTFVGMTDETDISEAGNYMYVAPMEARTGTQATISLKMKNSAAIRGFQFDLYLPEGMTVVKSSKGKIQGALSEGRLPEEDEHQLTFSEQPDGAIRFLCSSQYDETFTGNDGEVATLLVNVSENMDEGIYYIQLKNMKLTETDISKFYETSIVQSKLTVETYVLGDINGDDVVDVSDYTGVANHIHGNTPEGFNSKAADVDENGTVDVSDYTGIANIIHTGSIYGNTAGAPAMMMSGRRANTDVGAYDNVIYIEPFSATAGEQIELSIKMKNTAAIRGFQFDLYLPEGMTVVKSSKGKIQGTLNADRLPDEDEHQLTFSEQPDGSIRFLCSSQYDETFTGNDGELITLKVNVAAGMADGDYPIQMKKMKLTETDISKFYEAELIETVVTIGDGTSGISNVNVNDNDNRYYTLDGQLLQGKPTQKGVYIVNGRKVVMK